MKRKTKALLFLVPTTALVLWFDALEPGLVDRRAKEKELFLSP